MLNISNRIGFALSLAGGISSFLLGLFLPIFISQIFLFGALFATILQMIIIIGAVITIEGAIIFWVKPSISGKIIIVGALIAGLNIISLIGGIKLKSAKIENQESLIEMKKRRKAEQKIRNFLMENKGKAFTTNSISSRCFELQQLNLEIDEIERILKSFNSLGKIDMEFKDNETFYYIR